MNYLYLSKKINICSAYLNLISSLGWISLVLLITYYHMWILHSGGDEYYKTLPWKSWVNNPFYNLRQRVPTSSVQKSSEYPSAFISENGLSSFFSENKWWLFIQPIYLISIIASSLNLLFALISWFCFCKARDFNYLISSLANLLLPILGGLFSLKINNRLSRVWGPKSVNVISPAQACKLKAKTMFSKVFCDSAIPSY